MTNLPPIGVSRESTPGQHIDYLLTHLRRLEEERQGPELVEVWVSGAQGIGMVLVLAKILGRAAFVLYRNHQPPLGDRVDDLIRRLKEAEAEAKAKGINTRHKTTRAIAAWNQDMRKKRITHPDVVKVLYKAALVARQHFNRE